MTALASTVALAEDGYAPPEAKKSGSWVALLVAVVAALAIAVVAFKSSRRTHLD